jgi:hypothetical protein
VKRWIWRSRHACRHWSAWLKWRSLTKRE